ncbi:MAG: ABC transporter ATP-binding protein [Elioraea sp.]|nr:ABC transporter ATP-binding protein [Elioraea sp.]
MIAAEQVTFARGHRPILADVSLSFHPGELSVLVGPNGAGKSTLLRLLAGLLPPDRGTVLLEGGPLDRLARRDRARRIGWLAQGAQAAWGMTVREIVALGRLPHGDGSAAAIDRALGRLGLASLAGRRIDRLSGGEAKRAMIARVLAGEPRVLLLDEPTANLDPAAAFAVMRLLREVAAEGRAVVVVLHDLALAARFADRIVLLSEGRLVADGAATSVLCDSMAGRVFGVRFGAGHAVLPA